jgi:beta-glucosidase
MPLKELFDFARLKDMAPGESRTVVLSTSLAGLAFTRADGMRVIRPGQYEIRLGENEEAAVVQLRLEGDSPVVIQDNAHLM